MLWRGQYKEDGDVRFSLKLIAKSIANTIGIIDFTEIACTQKVRIVIFAFVSWPYKQK